jgi:hypothetical protein
MNIEFNPTNVPTPQPTLKILAVEPEKEYAAIEFRYPNGTSGEFFTIRMQMLDYGAYVFRDEPYCYVTLHGDSGLVFYAVFSTEDQALKFLRALKNSIATLNCALGNQTQAAAPVDWNLNSDMVKSYLIKQKSGELFKTGDLYQVVNGEQTIMNEQVGNAGCVFPGFQEYIDFVPYNTGIFRHFYNWVFVVGNERLHMIKCENFLIAEQMIWDFKHNIPYIFTATEDRLHIIQRFPLIHVEFNSHHADEELDPGDMGINEAYRIFYDGIMKDPTVNPKPVLPFPAIDLGI